MKDEPRSMYPKYCYGMGWMSGETNRAFALSWGRFANIEEYCAEVIKCVPTLIPRKLIVVAQAGEIIKPSASYKLVTIGRHGDYPSVEAWLTAIEQVFPRLAPGDYEAQSVDPVGHVVPVTHGSFVRNSAFTFRAQPNVMEQGQILAVHKYKGVMWR